MNKIDFSQETIDLMECSIRILYANGTHYDYKLNQAQDYTGDRENHPYIKNYLSHVKINETQQILILNKNGTERFGPIKIPSGKLAFFRMRTRQGLKSGIEKLLVIAIADKSSQILHVLDINGHKEITSPPEQGPDSKFVLMEEELARL